MLRKHGMMLLTLSAIGVIGCGSAPEPQKEPADAGPQAAVEEFLDALRNGDDHRTEQMLTAAARETTKAVGMVVAPIGSDTIQFEIGEVEYLADDGARVACTLSDLGQNQQRETQELIWMLRLEPEGWRIAGMAAVLVEGEPPRALDFENLEIMRAFDRARKPPVQSQRPESLPKTTYR